MREPGPERGRAQGRAAARRPARVGGKTTECPDRFAAGVRRPRAVGQAQNKKRLTNPRFLYNINSHKFGNKGVGDTRHLQQFSHQARTQAETGSESPFLSHVP